MWELNVFCPEGDLPLHMTEVLTGLGPDPGPTLPVSSSQTFGGIQQVALCWAGF